MSGAQLVIQTRQGDTWSEVFRWGHNGTPFNVTGYTARLTIKRQNTSPSYALRLTETSGIAINGPAGTFTPTITAAQTRLLSGKYVYDLEVTSPGGVVTTLAWGAFLVDVDPTDSIA